MDLKELWFSRKALAMRTKVLCSSSSRLDAWQPLQRNLSSRERRPKRFPSCSSQPFRHQFPLVLLWQASLEGTKSSDGKYSLIDSLGPRKHPIQLEINNLCHRTLRLGHYRSRAREGMTAVPVVSVMEPELRWWSFSSSWEWQGTTSLRWTIWGLHTPQRQPFLFFNP